LNKEQGCCSGSNYCAMPGIVRNAKVQRGVRSGLAVRVNPSVHEWKTRGVLPVLAGFHKPQRLSLSKGSLTLCGEPSIQCLRTQSPFSLVDRHGTRDVPRLGCHIGSFAASAFVQCRPFRAHAWRNRTRARRWLCTCQRQPVSRRRHRPRVAATPDSCIPLTSPIAHVVAMTRG